MAQGVTRRGPVRPPDHGRRGSNAPEGDFATGLRRSLSLPRRSAISSASAPHRRASAISPSVVWTPVQAALSRPRSTSSSSRSVRTPCLRTCSWMPRMSPSDARIGPSSWRGGLHAGLPKILHGLLPHFAVDGVVSELLDVLVDAILGQRLDGAGSPPRLRLQRLGHGAMQSLSNARSTKGGPAVYNCPGPGIALNRAGRATRARRRCRGYRGPRCVARRGRR